ncbi:MAG TPA: hypothetical protein VM324_04125 [Egibacteraceae bacterium]|nr:hypothetical protein [Egibacteraceae bacterium]
MDHDRNHDDEIRELHDGLARHLGERTAALLMKRVMAMEGRDWVTSRELSELGAAVMARFEQVDARFEQVDARFERVEARMEEGFARIDERIDARREFDDARFAMLAGRVDNGFDRVQSDLRGQLLAAVTTQTRTLLFALLGSFAVYSGLTLSLLR